MIVIVLRRWKELTMFLGEGEMAILFFLGLRRLPFGFLGGPRSGSFLGTWMTPGVPLAVSACCW